MGSWSLSCLRLPLLLFCFNIYVLFYCNVYTLCIFIPTSCHPPPGVFFLCVWGTALGVQQGAASGRMTSLAAPCFHVFFKYFQVPFQAFSRVFKVFKHFQTFLNIFAFSFRFSHQRNASSMSVRARQWRAAGKFQGLVIISTHSRGSVFLLNEVSIMIRERF